MIKSISQQQVEQTMQQFEIHKGWENVYRTPRNEAFYETAFDYLFSTINPSKDADFLDAGCGTCAHSIRLAKRGCIVTAIDFSASILDKAVIEVNKSGLSNRITIQREDITSFSFPDGTFSYILCWGVLMHIPDLEKAVKELERVLKKGGTLIISEINMDSFQSLVFKLMKKLARRKGDSIKYTDSGIEYWQQSASGQLMTRHININWLKSLLTKDGFFITDHKAGQFSEFYTKFKLGLIQNIFHALNSFWFKYIKSPKLSFGNIIVAKKV